MFNLKLKGRMLLGYTVPIVVYLALAGLVYSTTTKVSEAFREVERVQDVLLAGNNIDGGGQQMVRSVRGYLVMKNPEFIQEYQDGLTLARKSVEEANQLVTHKEQRDRISKMLEAINGYEAHASQIIQLIDRGKQAEAITLFRSGEGTKFVQQFDQLQKEFDKVQREFLTQQTKQVQESLNWLILALLIGSVALITLSVLIALLISSGMAKTINQSVNAIVSSSTEIAATVEQHERTAVEQSASVNQTTTTMDELGASSRQSAEQAESAANGARQVLMMIDGTAQGDRGNGASLREKVSQIAEQILRLSEQTSQIGAISNLVSDLANQTNMLALNAAVEAVRAGEHGKGFSVVAAEIRKLAEQSRKSAERINALVSDVQSATNSTVMVTDEGTKTVEGIVQAINTITLNSQQISLTAKQQAIAIQQVVDAMNTINLGASQTASGISQTKIGTQKLNEAALSLKAIV